MRQLQQTVARFVQEHEIKTSLEHRMLDLVSEVGELSKEALKATHYGKQPFVAAPSWDEEMGDILFSLICVANQSGVDLERAIERALTKYGARIAGKGNPESGR
jgi:NTP pyrophosphatase (non-canonical NTP hydrolase)